MKQIKPGRGPSMMGGIAGIFMIGFGIVWTILAAQASGIFALFGVLWTGMAIVNTIYQFKNATGKKRYSEYDIVDDYEEGDPWNERFHSTEGLLEDTDSTYEMQSRYCPYCGTKVEGSYCYCNKCGKKLP